MKNERGDKYYDEAERLQGHFGNKGKLSRMAAGGVSAWKEVNWDDVPEKVNCVKALETLAKAGYNEKKHIEDVKIAENPEELHRKEEKMGAAMDKWYEKLWEKHGLNKTIHPDEARCIEAETAMALDWIEGESLEKKAKLIADFEKNFKATIELRNEIRKHPSAFAKREFARRRGPNGMGVDQREVWNEILEELEGITESSTSVQSEFTKRAKDEDHKKDTKTLKAEIQDEYEKKAGQYKDKLMANIQYFGGDMVTAKNGSKIPRTANEFLEWLESLETFKEVDKAYKLLPGEIAERKAKHDQADEILENATASDQKKYKAMIALMRNHELGEFLPTLESAVQNESSHVAEYQAKILTARGQHGIDLFNRWERTRLVATMKTRDTDTQEALLKTLDADIKDRERVVSLYLNLPDHVRDDEMFIEETGEVREQMLEEAMNDLANENKSPLDNLGAFDDVNLEEFNEDLMGEWGDKFVEEKLEELDEMGMINEKRGNVINAIFGREKKAEAKNMNQDEYAEDDLKYWIRLNKGIDTIEEATNSRDKDKVRFLHGNRIAMKNGYTFHSGGEVKKLSKISDQQIDSGSDKIDELLDNADYDTDLRVMDQDGGLMEKPRLKLIRKDEQQAQMIANKILRYVRNAKVQNSREAEVIVLDKVRKQRFQHLERARKAA